MCPFRHSNRVLSLKGRQLSPDPRALELGDILALNLGVPVTSPLEPPSSLRQEPEGLSQELLGPQ